MKADKACIDVAAGRAPADLVFKNVNVVNVFSEEIITADVAVAGGVIAGVGSYRGRTELDCTDKFLCPGFIDAAVSKAVPGLSPGLSLQTCTAVYAPFTPSKSG